MEDPYVWAARIEAVKDDEEKVIEICREAFNSLDADSNGTIEREECASWFKTMVLKMLATKEGIDVSTCDESTKAQVMVTLEPMIEDFSSKMMQTQKVSVP